MSSPTAVAERKSYRRNSGKSRTAKREIKQNNEQLKKKTDEYLYLIGRPKLKEFLRYANKHEVDVPGEDELIAQWEAARTIVNTLEVIEAGLPDNPTITKLPLNQTYKPLITEFLKNPLVQHGFNSVPTEIALIELDQLVVHQKHIDLTHVRGLQRKLGSSPSAEQIFKACLPSDQPKPPVKWAKIDRNKYVFVSPSNDLRYLGAMALDPENIADYAPPGNLVGVVGLSVGFGSNFLNAIYTGKRLILNNGSHRAYALRGLGVTHVPCMVEHAQSFDQLGVLASTEIVEDPDIYLNHPRPSMLKDYFNPELIRVMQVHRRLRQITIKYEIEESFIPAF